MQTLAPAPGNPAKRHPLAASSLEEALAERVDLHRNHVVFLEWRGGAVWHHGDDPLHPGELAFDYDAIARFFADSGFEPFKVVYETFAPRYEATVFDLLRWMGVEPPLDLILPNPRTVKLADDRTEEWVARFREFQSATFFPTPPNR